MATYLGISYAKANVMVYFFLLPVVFSGLLDIIFRTSACRIAVAVFWLAVLTACRDFNAAADAIYSATVTFLEAFSVIGLSYTTASVLVCVVLPSAALLMLSIVAVSHGRPCRQVIPALCAILFLPQLHAEAQTVASTTQPTGQLTPASDLNNQQDKLTIETAISDLELKKALASLSAEKQRRELASKPRDLLLRDQEASLRTKELLNQKAELDFQVARLNTELDPLKNSTNLFVCRVMSRM